MTEEKKSMVPKLRFPEFTETWEQRKLEDCATIIMGQSPKSENYTNDPKDHILVQGNADLKNGQVAPRVWTTEVTKIGKVGDIILSVRAPVGEVGKTAYDVVLGRGVAAIRGNDFLLQTLLKLKECKYWGKVSAGSTFDSITSEILKSTLISMPAIEEQIKIGDFLSSVDKLITLHQRKLDVLNKLKKYLLQKMFPENGQLIPELRFPAFSGAWEQRKLSEIVRMNARIGWQNLRQSEFLDDGDFLLITGADFKNGRVNFGTCHYIAKERFDQDPKIQVEEGSILLTKDGTIGKVALVDKLSKPATLNAGVYNIVPKNRVVESRFLFQYLSAPFLLDYVNKAATGGTIKHLNQSILVDFPVSFPSVAEQEKIGKFLEGIDHVTTLHQRKLEGLRKLKKSLLQQMFV